MKGRGRDEERVGAWMGDEEGEIKGEEIAQKDECVVDVRNNKWVGGGTLLPLPLLSGWVRVGGWGLARTIFFLLSLSFLKAVRVEGKRKGRGEEGQVGMGVAPGSL